MIRVIVETLNDEIVCMKVSGHAGSAEYGRDLVCAGVSAVVTGGFNAIEDTNCYEIALSEGYAYIKQKNEPNPKDKVVLKTILTQLETIEESYNKFIEISRIEKKGN